MKKKTIISVLLSIMCMLTGGTSISDASPPTIEPASVVTVQSAEPPTSSLQYNIFMKNDSGNIGVSSAKNDTHTNETETKYDEEIYIGNKHTKKFHRPDCRTLPTEENRVLFASRADAVNTNYSPCKNCCP